MQTDYAQSFEFLKWWRPEGPWILTAIEPDSPKIETATFTTLPAVGHWLDAHGQTCNIYFTVNPLLRAVDKKPARTDVKELAWLHVDVDPRAGEDLATERARILAKLQAADPPFSGIIFSGGGYQGFYRVEDPMTINGQEEAYEDAKRYNLQLELLYGGDHCHSVDHIMRLPGTINRPNAKKRKAGRTEVMAQVIAMTGAVYPLDTFTKAPEVQAASTGFTANSVKVSGNIPRLASVDELTVTDRCKVVIVQGHDPDDPGKWADRSKALLYVCCELVRSGVDDDTIYSIITDPGFGISSHVLAQGSGSERAALRAIERAREVAIDPWLAKINDEYAVVRVGGKVRILVIEKEKIEDNERTRIHFMSFSDFENLFCNRFIDYTNAKGETVKIPVGKWWLNHPNRREFQSVVFSPGKTVPGAYNLWEGFAVPAVPGDCSLYLDHVRDIICGSSLRYFNYLIGWMATAIQYPAQPGHTAVVLQGLQGTGKGAFATHFGAVFGKHFMSIHNADLIFGQFNAHLRDCLVLFADEAFWAGNKKSEGQLKALITEKMLISRALYSDAVPSPNYIKLIMASNNDWVVPADMDDRRFFVLQVPDSVKEDRAYFAAMEAQMLEGGYEALLHYLLNYDLSNFDVRDMPKTRGQQDQKIQSFTPEQQWWHLKLWSGKVFEDAEDWDRQVFCESLCSDFIAQCKNWGMNARSNATKLGRFLQKSVPGGKTIKCQVSGEHHVPLADGWRSMKRPYVYMLPSLNECRAHWDKLCGSPFEWTEAREVECEKMKEPF